MASGPIRRVPATGGTLVAVTEVSTTRGEGVHSFPLFLPDGRRFLHYRASSRADVVGIYVGSIEGEPKSEPSRLVAATMGPVMTVTEGSETRLLFDRSGTALSGMIPAPSVATAVVETGSVDIRTAAIRSFCQLLLKINSSRSSSLLTGTALRACSAPDDVHVHRPLRCQRADSFVAQCDRGIDAHRPQARYQARDECRGHD